MLRNSKIITKAHSVLRTVQHGIEAHSNSLKLLHIQHQTSRY